MSCTITALNADACFLISIEPPSSFAHPLFSPLRPGHRTKPFTIIVDPWLTGTSDIGHRFLSTSKNIVQPYASSLASFEEPDIILVSQDKSDHCHEETLKSMPRRGGKFIILAESSAAKKIRGWNYFDDEKVITLPSWEKGVHEITAPGFGKVTIGLISQKWSLKAPTGLHKAIAISYEPVSLQTAIDTPPQTPPGIFGLDGPSVFSSKYFTETRPVSIIFAPHGCDSKAVERYATSKFLPIGALPLTALLHCFDEVDNPPWLGGNICKGLSGGVELAKSLSPEVWISAHDGLKTLKGVVTGKVKITKYEQEEVLEAVSPRESSFKAAMVEKPPPEVIKLGVGQLIRLPRGMNFLGPDDIFSDSASTAYQPLTPSILSPTLSPGEYTPGTDVKISEQHGTNDNQTQMESAHETPTITTKAELDTDYEQYFNTLQHIRFSRSYDSYKRIGIIFDGQ